MCLSPCVCVGGLACRDRGRWEVRPCAEEPADLKARHSEVLHPPRGGHLGALESCGGYLAAEAAFSSVMTGRAGRSSQKEPQPW